MEQVIRTNMLTYALIVLFILIFLSSLIASIAHQIRKKENAQEIPIIRIVIGAVMAGLLIWLSFKDLLPVSVAYYELKHDSVHEKTGVIESYEQEGKDRISIIIDGVEYKVVHSSASPAFIIGKDIVAGTPVRFEYGRKSKIIFSIFPADESSSQTQDNMSPT